MDMTYDPKKHCRRSIRLKGYHYARRGLYYVTICTEGHKNLFGKIADDVMVLSPAGQMIEKWWLKTPLKFPPITLDKYVVMPNHFHGIIAIVGAAPRGRPKMQRKLQDGTQCIVGAAPRGRPKERGEIFEMESKGSSDGSGQPHGVAPALGDVVGWYKTMTTNEYIRHVKHDNWKAFTGRLWQRNYFEHIIRNDYDLDRIKE